MKKILLATSECVPFIKTGGLADVAGALPKYLDREQFDVRVILPFYKCIPEKYRAKAEYITNFTINYMYEDRYVGIFRTKMDGVTVYFIDNEWYFSGDKPYTDAYFDLEKFAFFSKAVLSCLPVIDFKPDLVHCQDWQTGLIPVYIKDIFSNNPFYQGMKSIMTIHNLKFQGVWSVDVMKRICELSDYYFTSDKLESYKNGNMLKGGIVYADKVNTVSSTYAEEIKTPFYGEGLDGLMSARSNDLLGIVNGIDYEEWDPNTDKYIAKNFSVDDFRKEKVKNKTALQKELGLEVNPKKFMIGVVSRLTDQKGFDLIECVMDQICSDDLQLVVLGTGDEKYENMFRHYGWKYSDSVSSNIFYSNEMSHKIYAACDAFLMPSLFEPCGLSQIISLRYGTVPIVRETGGLKDTVEPYNEYEQTGVGFSFTNYNAHEMLGSIIYAKETFYNHKREWNKLVERGMNTDLSWGASAKAYGDLYKSLIGE